MANAARVGSMEAGGAFLGCEAAATELGIGVSRFRDLVNDGRIPVIRPGKLKTRMLVPRLFIGALARAVVHRPDLDLDTIDPVEIVATFGG